MSLRSEVAETLAWQGLRLLMLMLMKPPQSYWYSTPGRPTEHNAVMQDVSAIAAVS